MYTDVPSNHIDADGRLTIVSGSNSYSVVAARDKLFAVAKQHPVSHLFVLNWLLRGGVERSACNYIRAIAEEVGIENILVLVTGERSMTGADWLPDMTRLVNLLDLEPELSEKDAGTMTLDLIVDVQPQTVLLFNSFALWTAFANNLHAYRKMISSKLVAYLGGYELFVKRNLFGFNDGPISRSVDHIDLFITDTERLREAMIDRYPSAAPRIVSCYKALTEEMHVLLSASASQHKGRTERNKILWASRLAPPKRLDILSSIAQQMSDVQFEVFGHPWQGFKTDFLNEIQNIRLMGEYVDFSHIPKNDKAVFLYTSEADGLPNVLVEAAASGIPIAAPAVGGISELINSMTGWLIGRHDDIEEYVRTLKYLLADPEEARKRSSCAQTLIKERHSWSAFRERVAKLDIW